MHRRAWLAFVLVSVLWGMPYLFIKVAVDDLSPVFVAWSRIALGAAVVAPLAWRMGAFKGVWRRWPAVLAYSALEIAVPFVLIPAGERTISSSLSAIVVACMPLLVALLTLVVGPREPMTPVRAIGLLAGLVGVVLLMGVNLSSFSKLFGVGCVVAATLCYACSPIVITRWLRGLHPLGPVAVGLVASAVALTPFAVTERPTTMPSATALAAVAALGVLCTAAALIAYFYLIAEAGPGRASIVTYLNPAVAVALGVLVLAESVSTLTVAELLLVVAGSWFSTDGRLSPAARPAPARRPGSPAPCGDHKRAGGRRSQSSIAPDLIAAHSPGTLDRA